ncbi:MAG: PilZ domain-containing protein [Pseudobutyrivibrio sp.]|nr:PilZ domain-containing protein [Pseudobutyrivibrio sp.]
MKDGLLVDRILIGDGDLVWHKLCIVTIHNERDNNTYVFHSMSIEPIETQYGLVHKISSAFDGKKKQMRGKDRMQVIEMGSCFCRGTTYKAIIYDISLTGIAIILDGDVKMKIGDECSIHFTLGGKTEVLRAYEIEANVVRFFEVKGRVAIGCTIKDMPQKLLNELTNR